MWAVGLPSSANPSVPELPLEVDRTVRLPRLKLLFWGQFVLHVPGCLPPEGLAGRELPFPYHDWGIQNHGVTVQEQFNREPVSVNSLQAVALVFIFLLLLG